MLGSSSLEAPAARLALLSRSPKVQSLLELLDHNSSRATELARRLYSPGGGGKGPPSVRGAVSFLEASAGRAVPKNRHFTLGCRCADDVYVKSSNVLPINLPLSSCASNYVKVTRIYTPGCPPNETLVCSERLLALDKRVQRYFAPGLAWRTRWTKVSEHHFSDFSGSTHQPILGTPGGDLVSATPPASPALPAWHDGPTCSPGHGRSRTAWSEPPCLRTRPMPHLRRRSLSWRWPSTRAWR